MLSMDMKKKNLLSRGAFSILFLVISCTVSSAQKIESTTVHPVFNGLEWQKENGKLLVQFVTPDVVRVRFQPEGKFAGNGTDLCVSRKDQRILGCLVLQKECIRKR